MATLGVAGGALALTGRRVAGAVAAVAALAGLVDEAQNGPRVLRRAVRRRRTLANVVAHAGDPEAKRTLVVLTHHDAAQTGMFFNQAPEKTLYRIAPEVVARIKTAPPQWWVGVAPQLLTLASAASGRRAPARIGLALSLAATALVADIWRRPTVPGANDNLSGVASLVALAEMLDDDPVPGMRVLLVSCGAEESLQDGIRAFVARHRADLDPGTTWFLNVDTVGSPHLVLLEGEGPIWMEDYADPSFRDVVARCADACGIALERGLRARASTDGIIPSRAGYPTATVVSLTAWRRPANYHLMTDVPGNLDYTTIADATRLAYAVTAALA